MKEELLATCIKHFVTAASNDNLRLDGRNFDEYRPIEVHFGKEWGNCQVSFGETKVLAKVTCEIQLPKATRPNEGLLHVNVELSPMAAAHFESGPQSDLGVHLNRLLDKFFKESRCVDVESLCIVSEEKVWNLRVDIIVLNSDGNLIGCCSAAALAALLHFRRPDFTLSGEQVIIHSTAEKDALPVSLHHHPTAIAYAIFNNGERVMVDPTSSEERVSQAQLVLAVNTYRELCGLHLSGTALAAPQLIMQCAVKSATFSTMIITKIKEALAEDLKARNEGSVAGLSSCIKLDRILSSSKDRTTFRITGTSQPKVKSMEVEEPAGLDSAASDDDIQIIEVGEKSAEMWPIKKKLAEEKVLKRWEPTTKGNKWIIESVEKSDEESESSGDEEEGNEQDKDGSDSDVEVIKQVTIEDRVIDKIELSGDSEEEDTIILKSSDIAKG